MVSAEAGVARDVVPGALCVDAQSAQVRVARHARQTRRVIRPVQRDGRVRTCNTQTQLREQL